MKSTNTSRKTDVVAQKATLAKLMATENIRVEHHKVSTASFNLLTRTLTLPIWDTMNGDLYDLLTGHEVGHALFTPMEGWHESVVSNAPGKNFKHYLNVLEDARIEKLIKRKYPGLRRSFLNGYADLYKRDFFGVQNYSTDKLNSTLLVDRLNLYFKVGVHLMIQFSAAEAKFVARAEALETFEDVDALAREVYAYDREQLRREKEKAKQKQKPQKSDTKKPNEEAKPEKAEKAEKPETEQAEAPKPEPEEAEAEKADGEPEIESESDETSAEASADGDEADEGSDESDISASGAGADTEEGGEETDEDFTDAGGSAGGTDSEDEEESPESITDSNFRAKEGSLVKKTNYDFAYLDLPKCNLDEAIITNEVLRASYLANAVSFVDSLTGKPAGSYVDALRSEFKSNNGKFIDLMAKEFEMRKNASQYARQRTSRSGELDTNKLSNYRFTGDIFKRLTTVEKGKSHGMVLFLDMSGSMSKHIRKTVDQLLVLVSFCKKVNIPFDVYGFSDHKKGIADREGGLVRARKIFGDESGFTFAEGSNTKVGDFQLNHLISSNMNERVYKESFDMMLLFGSIASITAPKEFSSLSYRLPGFRSSQKYMLLNGTPLSETIIASRKVIENFRAATQVQIVTSVYLTDGDGNGTFTFSGYNNKVVIVDPITKISVEAKNGMNNFIQDALVELVGKLTDCNTMNFYLTKNKDVLYKTKYWYREAGFSSANEAKSFANNNGYIVLNNNRGFDKYFFIDAEVESEDGKLEVSKGSSKSSIANQFKKFNQRKKTNRALAVSVIDVVAVA